MLINNILKGLTRCAQKISAERFNKTKKRIEYRCAVAGRDLYLNKGSTLKWIAKDNFDPGVTPLTKYAFFRYATVVEVDGLLVLIKNELGVSKWAFKSQLE